jgi:hypothetical protein
MERPIFCDDDRFRLKIRSPNDLVRVSDIFHEFRNQNVQGRVNIMVNVLQQFEWQCQSDEPPMYSKGKKGQWQKFVIHDNALFLIDEIPEQFWLGKKCAEKREGTGVLVNLSDETIYVGGFVKGLYQGYGVKVDLVSQTYYEGWWCLGKYNYGGVLHG